MRDAINSNFSAANSVDHMQLALQRVRFLQQSLAGTDNLLLNRKKRVLFSSV